MPEDFESVDDDRLAMVESSFAADWDGSRERYAREVSTSEAMRKRALEGGGVSESDPKG